MSNLYERFASKRVFVTYVLCWVITLGTMIASIITYFVADKVAYPPEKLLEHVALCVGAFIALHIPMHLRTKMHFYIPPLIHIAIATLILAHFVLGEVYRFYDHVIHFDKALHILGGTITAVCGFSIVTGFSKRDDGSVRLSPLFAALFSFCFSVTLLTMWEFFEYIVDGFSGINMQRWHDSLLHCTNGVLAENTVIEGAQCVENSAFSKTQFAEVHIDGVKHWFTSAKRGSGLLDTMQDLIVGAIGAAIVSALGALWLVRNPENITKYVIVWKIPGIGQAKAKTTKEHTGGA